jgi:transcriptional regulator with XRE-family HTH domain
MATTLAPVDSREVVRCDQCHLVQFKTVNNLCRRCRTSLEEDEPEPILTPCLPVEAAEEPSDRSEVHVAMAIRSLRLRAGLSQRQLALRMGVPRTYVSKIENEKATPTLSSLARLAAALEVSVPDLLRACGPSREDEINEALADPFVAELAEFSSKLNAMQLANVLSQVCDMVEHPRRYAQN